MSGHWLTRLIAPPRCHLCAAPLGEDEEYLCAACHAALQPQRFVTGHHTLLTNKILGLFPFEEAMAGYVYEPGGSVSRLIQDFKYRDCPGLAEYMGRRLVRELFGSGFFGDVSMIVPVPIHWSRRLRRGYNQAERLARGIGSELDVPVVESLKARRHASQTTRTHSGRHHNAEGKYYCRDAAPLHGQHVLLVDDVCTTGATLESAAKALLGACPDVRLTVLTLASTV